MRMVDEVSRKRLLLDLFVSITNKKAINQPIKNVYGILRDKEAINREITLVTTEIINEGLIKTNFSPKQLAKIITAYIDGKSDNQIARELGDEKFSRSVGRARIRLKLFRDNDFNIPFDYGTVEKLIEEGRSLKSISEDLGISYSSFRLFLNTIEMEKDKAIDPYMERIMAVIEDRDLSERMTQGIVNDGLNDAIDQNDSEMIGEI